MPDSRVPNLDAMTPDELMHFWHTHRGGRAHRILFPNGGRGTRRAAADLANYASNIATAKRCRLDGYVATALMYESLADRIYARLPAFARW